MGIVKKYNVQKQHVEINTEPMEKQVEEKGVEKCVLKDIAVQVDLDCTIHNTTKLSAAQELLKNPPSFMLPPCPRCEENKMFEANR